MDIIDNNKDNHSTSDCYYLEKIKHLDNVECILKEKIGKIESFITIINRENEKTRNQIYDTELEMFEKFEKFENISFKFAVYLVLEKAEMDIIINNKNILFRK